jgi:hypothetical protein
VIAKRLQIPYTDEDFRLYKKLTGEVRIRQLAFMLALFKVKRKAHIQVGISGALGNGKSTTGMVMAKYDSKYTRILLKVYQMKEEAAKVKFGLSHVIISPKDPDSKFIRKPDPWNSYVVDEGESFFSTGEATTASFKSTRRAIIHNRKMHPSMYWIFPNIFKMPNAALELLEMFTMKLDVDKALNLMPSRVIQLPDKFDRKYIEKMSKWTSIFHLTMRHHSAYLNNMHTPKVKEDSKFWKGYLAKYEKYATTDAEKQKKNESAKLTLFKEVATMLDKKVYNFESKKDLYMLFENMLKNEHAKGNIQKIAENLSGEFYEYYENKISEKLVASLYRIKDAKSLTAAAEDTGETYEN